MRAPNIDELHKFEDHIEGALKQALGTLGISVYTQRDVENLETPRIEVQLGMGAATGQKARDSKRVWRNNTWNAQVIFLIATGRIAESESCSKPDDNHAIYRAHIRSVVSLNNFGLPRETLPYYYVTVTSEAGTSPSVQAPNDDDVSQITFNVIISIRKDSWPA